MVDRRLISEFRAAKWTAAFSRLRGNGDRDQDLGNRVRGLPRTTAATQLLPANRPAPVNA